MACTAADELRRGEAAPMRSQTHAPTTSVPIFDSIVCGVDGSRPSLEAARQAAVLAGGGAA